ncbi:MAG: response regulator [Bryobacterales bacterium]|nr:response regulator [Bryobacteraceae bacterium]MDW8353032.1 response regulator [Bryobacterales bacterium]
MRYSTAARVGSSPAFVEVAVVDENYDFRRQLEELLREEDGLVVRSYAHWDDFSTALRHRAPDMVFLDLTLDNSQGLKALEQLKASHPELCVIATSARPSLDEARATFKLKAFDYLSKPLSQGQVRHVVRSAVEAYRLDRSPHERLRDRLGRRLKMLRIERDWSLKDLSAVTLLSVSQISSIERGAHLPSIESLLILCRALDKRPSEILASIDF